MTHIVAVAGGKGGTGKTFVAANIAYLLGNRSIETLLVDADVENPSIQSILGIHIDRIVPVKRFKPIIDQGRCNGCGLCVEKCPEHALTLLPNNKLLFIESLCAGCGVCRLICPFNAIKYGEVVEGVFKYGRAGNGIDVVIGELVPGNRRSIVLVTKLIEEHRELFKKYSYVIIDSPPGSGGALYPIIKYSSHIIAVTEPTPLGVHDLRKFLTLMDKYGDDNKHLLVVINKYGLPSRSYSELEEIIRERDLPYVKVPYSDLVPKTYILGKPLASLYTRIELSKELDKIANFILR